MSGTVHIRRQKSIRLTQKYIEYKNFIKWAQWYGLIRTTLALAYVLHYLSVI